MPARANAMIHCIDSVHQRFVCMMSTNGLQNGFITHGRYSQPVYRAMSVLGYAKALVHDDRYCHHGHVWQSLGEVKRGNPCPRVTFCRFSLHDWFYAGFCESI